MHQIYSAISHFIDKREVESLNRQLISAKPINAREIEIDEKRYVNFSSNDYLGLRYHPKLIEAAKSCIDEYGTGSGASRLVTGNFDLYAKAEQKIAAWKNREAALIFASGYQCNTSVLASLFDKNFLGEEPLIFSDKLIHASMHQGCKLAGIKQIRFNHNDITHLSTLLEKYKDDKRPKFILTESVFSMDGDIAPLDGLYALRDLHDAFLIVDEAHAAGVFGDNGNGLAHKADLIIGTCGKALGCFGAYVACDQKIKDFLINHCGGLIYSTALPPSAIAAIEAAVDLMPSLDSERKHVITLAQNFRQQLDEVGYHTGQSQSQIVPMIIGDADKTVQFSDSLKDGSFWAGAIRPPTVPQGTSRIRFAFSAAHTESDVANLIQHIITNKESIAA